jgi:hypothetical protein
VPDHIKLFITAATLDEPELLVELELLEELEQLVELELELKELELKSKILLLELLLELELLELELLELELLEQLLEGIAGLNGVVRSAPQPCNNITAQRHDSADAKKCDGWQKKLIIRVQIFQKGLFNCSDIGNQRIFARP